VEQKRGLGGLHLLRRAKIRSMIMEAPRERNSIGVIMTNLIGNFVLASGEAVPGSDEG
jgi:hypothetical protein